MGATPFSPTILLVEDDAVLAKGMAGQLQDAGYSVLTVFHGQAALEILPANPQVDLILMDIDLGDGPGGPEIAKQVLSQRNIPVVFLSGQSEPDVAAKTEQVTCYGYVVKGSNEQVLLATIKTAFQLHRASCLLTEREALLKKALEDQCIATQVLQEKSDALELFFDNALGLMCFADLDGHFLRVNHEWERVLGYSVEELTGRRFLDLIHPDDVPATLALMSQLSEQQPVLNFVNRYRHRDGSYRWIEWRSKPYQDRLLGTATDITERVQAEAALRASEERYRTLVQISPDSISMTDLNGKFTMANPAALKQLGYTSLAELQGSGVSSYDLIAPPDRQRALENAARTLEQGEVRNIEYRLTARDGAHIPVEISAAVIRDAEGSPVSFIGISRDISERKRADADQARLLAEKSTLLRDLQHRVKNSLALITSLISLEQKNAQQVETRTSLNEIYDRVNSLAKLYNILYESPDTRQIFLEQYLGQVAESLSSSYLHDRRGVAIHMQCEPVLIDSHQATPFGLILNELLTNALKYAFPNERSGKIWIALYRDGEQVVLEVSDDGIGLPHGQPGKGNPVGLGLQLVELLASQLCGSLVIAGGARTCFTVRVPYNEVMVK